jgi:hypothetical protein
VRALPCGAPKYSASTRNASKRCRVARAWEHRASWQLLFEAGRNLFVFPGLGGARGLHVDKTRMPAQVCLSACLPDRPAAHFQPLTTAALRLQFSMKLTANTSVDSLANLYEYTLDLETGVASRSRIGPASLRGDFPQIPLRLTGG